MRIAVGKPVLAGNQAIAGRNRAAFARHSVLVLNLMSSPGAGKTTFLERWLPQVRERLRIGVIEGDIATTLDAERIAACGVPAVQINTRGACHLDARMIERVLCHFDLPGLDCLIIENVGNLVCPAEFDLGETLRITLASTAEGEEKPVKYPASFRGANAVLLTKTDLLPVLTFDVDRFCGAVRELNPAMPIFPISAVTGEGMAAWTEWLMGRWRRQALRDGG
jgi:hydrogenase nickel incorporation protein HypB